MIEGLFVHQGGREIATTPKAFLLNHEDRQSEQIHIFMHTRQFTALHNFVLVYTPHGLEAVNIRSPRNTSIA